MVIAFDYYFGRGFGEGGDKQRRDALSGFIVPWVIMRGMSEE